MNRNGVTVQALQQEASLVVEFNRKEIGNERSDIPYRSKAADAWILLDEMAL